MDDPVPMGRVQSLRDFCGVFQRTVNRQGTSLQASGQRLAFEVLHDEEFAPGLMTHVVKGADMWVVEAGDDTRLPLEPLAALGIRRQVRRQYFDGNRAVESRVGGAVHLPHPACTNQFGDLVRSEPDSWLHRSGEYTSSG